MPAELTDSSLSPSVSTVGKEVTARCGSVACSSARLALSYALYTAYGYKLINEEEKTKKIKLVKSV